MRKVHLVLLFTCVSSIAFAQFNETIRTRRPGQSIGPYTVGLRVFQVQSEVGYFASKNNGQVTDTGALTNTTLRYGLTEFFEMSALAEYKSEQLKNNGIRIRQSGWSALDIGMRYHIYSGKGLTPSIGFQIRWRLPKVGGDYEINQLAPRFILATMQDLTNKLFLTTNWGASWNGTDGTPKGNYTAHVSYAATPKLNLFLENYGSLEKKNFDTQFDSGLAYLVNPDFRIDLYGGFGKNNNVNNFFISSGISWRTTQNR